MKGNYIYHLDMYNEDLKREFISTYSEDTHKFYERVFYNSAPLEKELGKDVYEFSTEEVEKVLYDLRPPTIASSRANASILRTYFNWAIRRGMTMVNALDDCRGYEWFKKFVVTGIKLYVSASELMEIEDYCINAQDAVIYRLLFEGVYGKGCSELINLTRSDVDFDNKILTLRDGDSVRKLNVSLRCIELIKDALNEEVYMKKNGESDVKDNQREYFVLSESDYVIRPIKSRNVSQNINNMIVTRRVKLINELFGYPKLTPKNIQRSGMIHMFKEMGANPDEITELHYQKIANRFGLQVTYAFKDLIQELVKE